MMISNWNKPFGLQGFYKKIQRFKGYNWASDLDSYWPNIKTA